MEQLLKKLMSASTLEELEKVSEVCLAYFEKASDADKEVMKNQMWAKTQMIMEEADRTRLQAEKLLKEIEQKSNIAIEVNGQKYSLNDWLTIKEYCEKFGLGSTSVVTNWIKRGIVPTDNVLYIKQLNNLKLIKAIRYMS